MTFEEYYQKNIPAHWHPDLFQQTIVRSLSDLGNSLQALSFQRWWHIFRKSSFPKGIYIYGGVGRGKTSLMDMFFNFMPISSKRRLHFHSFMLKVHEDLRELRNDVSSVPPIQRLAKQLSKEMSLLCLDEFQVTNIADAMILKPFFSLLFEEGVTIVLTSNQSPDDLYPRGLHRERFLPFIEILNSHLKIVSLEGTQDYRFYGKRKKLSYFYPLSPSSYNALEKKFIQITDHKTATPFPIHLGNRTWILPRSVDKIGWALFEDLCIQPRGAADFHFIGQNFSVLFIVGIPLLSPELDAAAQRFITLIDVLYDYKVRLFSNGMAPLENFYQGKLYKEDYKRIVSRLYAMHSLYE